MCIKVPEYSTQLLVSQPKMVRNKQSDGNRIRLIIMQYSTASISTKVIGIESD